MTTDLVCFDDITLMADETDDPLVQLEQDVYHQLIENRGENLDDPDGGFGLEQALSLSVAADNATITNLQHSAAAFLKKDGRIRHAVVAITNDGVPGNAPQSYTVSLEIDTDAGHLSSSFTTPTGGTAGGS